MFVTFIPLHTGRAGSNLKGLNLKNMKFGVKKGTLIISVVVLFLLAITLEYFTQITDMNKPHVRYQRYASSLCRQNFTTTLLRTAGEVLRNSDVILLTLLNEAYVPFTYSWLCNTKLMEVHKQVLLIATDRHSFNLLKSGWPDVKIVYIPVNDVHGDQEYSKVGYLKLMNIRTQVIQILLQNNIPLLLFETDCLWIKNPVAEIMNTVKGNDILAVMPTHQNGYMGGFICLLPTNATRDLWYKLSFKMWELYVGIKDYAGMSDVSEFDNDQVYFSNLIRSAKHHLKVAKMSNEKIVDGKWYTDFTDLQRRRLKPLVINNNWIKGNANKIRRAKAWGHWFISDTHHCKMSQVMKITQSN